MAILVCFFFLVLYNQVPFCQSNSPTRLDILISCKLPFQQIIYFLKWCVSISSTMYIVNFSSILFTYIAIATNQYWQIERTPLRTESEHYSSVLMSQSKIGNSCKAKQRLLAYKTMLQMNT